MNLLRPFIPSPNTSDEHFNALMQDRGIVRNGAKIRAVQINAKLVLDLASTRLRGAILRRVAEQ